MQQSHSLSGFRLHGVGKKDPSGIYPVHSHQNRSSLFRGKVGDLHVETLQKRFCATQNLLSLCLPPDAVAGDLLQKRARRDGNALLLSKRENTLGNGVGGGGLAGSAKRKHLAVHLLYPEITFGQSAGFVHGNHLDAGQGLHGNTVLKENALFTASTHTGEEGQRHAEYQRAGTAHNQKTDGGIQPVIPVTGEKGGDYGSSRRGQNYDRRVNTGKPGDEPVNFRLACSSGLHGLQNSCDHGLTQRLFCSYDQLAQGVDTAGDDGITGMYHHGYGFAGNGCSIQLTAALKDHAIQRDPVAGAYQQQITGLGRLRGNGFAGCQDHGIWAQISGFQDLPAAALYCFFLEILTQTVEQHNAYGLRVLTNGKSAQSGDAHKEIFVKHLTPQKMLARSDQNLQTQNQISGNISGKTCQRMPKLQQKTGNKQRRANKKLLERTALVAVIMCMFVSMRMGLFVFLSAAAILKMPVIVSMGMAMLRFCNGAAWFNAIGDLLHLGKQSVRIFRGDVQLPGGKHQVGVFHLRQGSNCPFYFSCAIGTVDILKCITFFHGEPSLIFKYEQLFMCWY